MKRNACVAKEHETSSGQQNKVEQCLTSTVALRCIPADGTFAALTFEDHDFSNYLKGVLRALASITVAALRPSVEYT